MKRRREERMRKESKRKVKEETDIMDGVSEEGRKDDAVRREGGGGEGGAGGGRGRGRGETWH